MLDPVAAGIGRTRTAILQAFKAASPTMIRANASEVIALANMWGLNTETVGDASEHRPAGVGIRRRRGVRNRRGGGAGTVSDRTARQAFLP